jgi:hypothetical protein
MALMSRSDWGVGVAVGLLALMAGFGVSLCFRLHPINPASFETCWKDPHPERSLDFDFYTGIDGKPNRCGYLQTGVLPTVIGDRGLDLILQCYPLARVECRK